MESEINEGRLRSALTNLTDKGELTQAQAALVISSYQEEMSSVQMEELKTPASRSPVPEGKRKWLGELGGYVGGAFTLTAGFILLGRTWSEIDDGGKVAILVALAAILFGVGVLIGGLRPGDAPRRLAGTLFGFGAISGAGAGGYAAPQHHELLVALLVGFLVALLGYWRVRSASSHIALFGFFALLVSSLFDSAHPGRGALAIVIFMVGATWFFLTYRTLIAESLLGLIIGTATMVIAGEMAFINDSRLIAYVLLATVAVIGFRIYATSGEWPPLAGAVAATTLGIGQVVGTTLGGALGAALGLLTAGLALLGLSAWILRRRK